MKKADGMIQNTVSQKIDVDGGGDAMTELGEWENGNGDHERVSET